VLTFNVADTAVFLKGGFRHSAVAARNSLLDHILSSSNIDILIRNVNAHSLVLLTY